MVERLKNVFFLYIRNVYVLLAKPNFFFQARFLSAKEVESAGAQIRQMGSTSSSQSEEESGTESGERRASASKALNAAMAPLIKSRHREGTPGSVTSGDGGGVGALPRRDGEGDTDSVFESEPGGQASGGNNERRRQAFVLIVTSDDRLEFTLTPGAVETLYKFEKVGLWDHLVRLALLPCFITCITHAQILLVGLVSYSYTQ